MRSFILATVALASLAVPLAAQAQDEIHRDRHEVRQQVRELDAAKRSGDPRAIRQEQRDVNGARREMRSDLRDRRDDRGGDRYAGRDDRRDYRRDDRRDDRRGDEWRDNRGGDWRDHRGGWDGERRYNAGRYEYPRGYGYRAWGVGGFLPRSYWGERYWVARPVAYGLPYAGPGTRWIRVGPDALLIRNFNGSVIRVARGIFY
ncbi:DUF1090 family protein [Sphingosinicellaceae bacterium]|nr:DUF1090 family protein [Sphingosinicellaceae bacterium]